MSTRDKQQMSRRQFGVKVGGVALAASMGFPMVTRAQRQPPYRVGLIQPMSGNLAYNGQLCRAGALKAIEEVNQAGGIKSLGGAQVVTLLGDTQGRVELGVAEVEKMHQAGVDAYIGAYQSAVGLAASQAASRYNTPFMIDSGVSDNIVNRGLKNVFRFSPGYTTIVEQGAAALDAINKAAGSPAKSIVIVHESGELGTGTAKILAVKLPEIGIEVKDVIPHDTPSRSFDNIVARIKALAPDLVSHTCYRNDYILLSQTLHRQRVPLVAEYSILSGGFDDKFVREMPEVARYNMNFNHWYNVRDPRVPAYIADARKAGFDFGFEYYCAYNAAHVLLDAVERAGSADREAVIDAISASTWDKHFMPYGPTKFVDGQNMGAQAVGQQILDDAIRVVYPNQFAEREPVFRKVS